MSIRKTVHPEFRRKWNVVNDQDHLYLGTRYITNCEHVLPEIINFEPRY